MRSRRARGAALLLVVVALVVVGGLAAAGFLLALGDRRGSTAAVELLRALHAAEEGAALEVAGWSQREHHWLGLGDFTPFSGVAGPGGAAYRGRVRRLGTWLYVVDVEGTSGSARQRVGFLVRPRPLTLPLDAALAVTEEADLAGLGAVRGEDQAPPGWSCPAPGPPVAGVKLDPAARLDTARCGAQACALGTPPFLVDSVPLPPSSLAAAIGPLADKTLSPGLWHIEPAARGGRCAVQDPANWGDPDDPIGPCGDYFPVIRVPGDLEVIGGRGQGVLLVEGDLVAGGGFRFFGPVVVTGRLTTTSEGGHFKGGVVAARVVLAQNAPGGEAVRFSSCVLGRALAATSDGELLVSRAWLRPSRNP